MGRDISFFADYQQAENRLTNYCGVMLKILYEESPQSFENLMADILEEDSSMVVGPVFTQQKRKSDSTPDLVVHQPSFTVFFEVKTTNWFYNDQIKRHINSLPGRSSVKALILMTDETDALSNDFSEQIQSAREDGIILSLLSFEEFLEALERFKPSDGYVQMLEEFREYLDRNNYLPKWKYLLDVVNCSRTMREVQDGGYTCPATGGPYSHRKAKYFGPYKNKKVETIYEIEAVVIVSENSEDTRVEHNLKDEEESVLIKRAREHLQNHRRIERDHPWQVFLLTNPASTNFEKKSKGPLWGSKRYFWDIAIDCQNSRKLASKLAGKYWEDFD